MIQTAEWRREKRGDDAAASEPVLDLTSVSVRYLTSGGLNTAAHAQRRPLHTTDPTADATDAESM